MKTNHFHALVRYMDELKSLGTPIKSWRLTNTCFYYIIDEGIEERINIAKLVEAYKQIDKAKGEVK